MNLQEALKAMHYLEYHPLRYIAIDSEDQELFLGTDDGEKLWVQLLVREDEYQDARLSYRFDDKEEIRSFLKNYHSFWERQLDD